MFSASFLSRLLAAAGLAAAAPLAAPLATTPAQNESPTSAVFAPLAQTPDGRVETRHLTLRLSSSPSPAARGGRVTLVVDVTPKPKMHVYAPEQKDIIPVSLALTPAPDIRAGTLRLPPSEPYFFAPLNETQRVYSKPFRLEQPVTIAGTRAMRGGARTRTITIAGRLRYQACDDTICYLPQEIPLEWTVTLDAS